MKRFIAVIITFFALYLPIFAQNESQPEEKTAETSEQLLKTEQTLNTINAVAAGIQDISDQIKAKTKELREAGGTQENKDRIKAEINTLNDRKTILEKDLERISTGIDVEFFEAKPQKNFKWQEEIHDLLGPVIEELKSMTDKPRQIEKLRSDASFYNNRLTIAKKALENVEKLIADAEEKENKKVIKYLNDIKRTWKNKEQQINNQLTVVNYQLEEKLKEKKSLLEATQNLLRLFFKSRSQNLMLALLAFLCVLLTLQVFYRLIIRFLPHRIQKKYPFYVRLGHVLYLFMMVIGASCTLLIVLYATGDWVLLSVSIILFFGIVWTARQGFTKFFTQIKLLLNLGAIRENERVVYKGIPWKVVSINFYSHFENPELKVGRIRLALEQLIGLSSRPYDHDEPWFPCRVGDWLLMSDGTYGRVILQTPEIVQLVLLGGSHKTYLTEEFLKLGAVNLSTNFRVSVTFGLDYAHQIYITRHIPDRLRETLVRQLIAEGYGSYLFNLRVEFKEAAASSLNLEILADFSGKAAQYYSEISRALQRISVDACNRYGWIIPFQQITIHHADKQAKSPEDYRETISIAPSSPPPDYQKTVVIQAESEASATQTITAQAAPEESPVPQAESSTDLADYAATDVETEFYQKWIKKHQGDKYKFCEKLFSGGMGAIFKVLERDLQRISAMKVLLPGLKEHPDTLNNFISEAKITGFLEHPNIVPVHELGLLPQVGIFFTMKLAKGETLNAILAELKEGNPEYIEKYNTYHLLNIFRKVCDAVSYAHSINIVHQDIKPHNIMVGKYGEVFLMDWGIAKYVGNVEQEPDSVAKEFLKDILSFSKEKKSFHIKGSPAYMSPEQVSGDPQQIDKASDIFLLGATLYHIFTLEPPYQGDDIHEILLKAKNAELIPPETRNPAAQVPSEMSGIIMKAMALYKHDRYSTVEDMVKDIDDFIAGKWSPQEKKFFAAGETIMKEGEIGEEAYVILKGSVVIYRESGGHRVILNTAKEGDIIGEIALIIKAPRSASVEAAEDTEVAVFTARLISYNIRRLPPYMEKIVSAMTERLLAANANIHPHLTTDCTDVVLKQLRLIFKDKSGDTEIQVPFNEVVSEISGDLGIPEEKVCDILSMATDRNLIVREDDDSLEIPDTEALNRFISELKA
jgi:CRP-like cAMP-binding protein/thiamine kinase-like enzyme